MTNINSSIIEIPHLGIADCTLITNSPKNPAQTFFYDTVNGIDGNGTARLSWDSENKWWKIDTDGTAIACAAQTANAGTSTTSIWLYPFAYIDLQQRKLDTLNHDTVGDFIVKEESRVHLKGKRKPTDTWTGTNQTLYYDHINDQITKSSGTNFNYIGQCGYAHPTSGNSVYYPVMFAYEEQYHQQGFKKPKLVPHRLNASVGINQKLITDISGGNFVWSTTPEHGTFNDLWAAETPNITANEVYAMDYSSADGKMILSYLEMIYSALNTTHCMLIPTFGGVQKILNAEYGELYSYPDIEDSEIWTENTFGRAYTYWYRLRTYRTLSCITKTVKDTNNASVNHGNLILRSQKVNFAMEIPTDLTWERESYDDLPWNAPGPRDLSDRFLIFAGDYGMNILSPSYKWELWHKNGLSGSTYYPTKTNAMKPVNTQTTINSGVLFNEYYPRIIAHDGRTDYINYYGLNTLWYWDVDAMWNLIISSWDDNGSMNLKYSIWKYAPDGTEVLLQDWQDMTKTNWFTKDTIQYYQFSFNHKLSDFGFTPDTRVGVPFYKIRQYFSSVTPYLSYQGNWGFGVSLNLNHAAGLSIYNYQYALPYPLDIRPLKLKNQRTGASITGIHNIGKCPAMKRFNTSWAGDITVEVAEFNSVKKFRLISTLDPTVTDSDLRYLYMQRMNYRVQRKSDGMYIDQYFPAVSTYNSAKGIIWSRKAIKKEISSEYYDMQEITHGAGVKQYYPISFKTNWMIVDKTPNRETEEYEIVCEVVGKAEFMSQLNQKVFYKTKVLTFSL